MNTIPETVSSYTNFWPNPSSRQVGLFTDLSLYAEALSLAAENGTLSINYLREELRPRLQRMAFVSEQSRSTVSDLLRELKNFGWLQSGQKQLYEITREGKEALALSNNDSSRFLRLLTGKMQSTYVVPGWFVRRLWEINPTGQGELIVPAPLPIWRPASRAWETWDWSGELKEQTLASAHAARRISSNAFPITNEDWVCEVERAWNRLSALKPRIRGRLVHYSPRRRLAFAMREACIGILFNVLPYGCPAADLAGARLQIHPRTYMAWCPRLEALELIFYTDWHPLISGRLLFPISAFRESANDKHFEPIQAVSSPDGKCLWLHQPEWNGMRSTFLDSLISVHSKIARKVGALYVSLLDVRDEVCRLLRISSLKFDRFLELSIKELPSDDFPSAISVETDIRADQSSRVGQLRRPVYLSKVPHSLIAIAHIKFIETNGRLPR